MLDTQGKQALLSAEIRDSLRRVARIDDDRALVRWLSMSLKAVLPGHQALLALCPAETRDWQLTTLPERHSSIWPGDHPVQDEIREMRDMEPQCLGQAPIAEFGSGRNAWAMPLRNARGELLGAVILAWPGGERLSALAKDWLLGQGSLVALTVERLSQTRRGDLLQQELSELESLKAGFIDAVSHELKTPLTSILGFSSLALDRSRREGAELPAPLPEFLRSIHREAQRLERLVDEVLVMANMASATTNLQIEDRAFPDLVDEFQLECLPRMAGARRVEIPPPLPDVTLRVDSRQFLRILEHLVGNALKFSPEDRPVRVGWEIIAGRRRGDLSDYLRVDVRDQGPGIPELEQERIFRRFYQIDGSSTREQGGTGLGLAAAKAFTEAMGGKLRVRSEQGRGSIFSFTVPALR